MLEREELLMIKGGVNWTAVGIVVGILITLFAGIVDGYFRPLECNE